MFESPEGKDGKQSTFDMGKIAGQISKVFNDMN